MNTVLNFGTFLRYLKKNKIYTLINVFGLAVSLSFVILIALYVKRELSVDTFHRNAERIYLLGNEHNLDYNYRIGRLLPERYPEIEKVCPVIPFYMDLTCFSGEIEKKFKTRLVFTDTTFFSFFDFKLAGTPPQHALNDPDAAVISRTFARKAFGRDNPVGEKLRIGDSLVVTVRGVAEDLENSVIPYGDIMVRIDNIRHFNSGMDSEDYSNAGYAYLFLMEKKGANLRAKTGDMASFFKEFFWIFQRGMYKEVTLTPLKEVYFSSIRGHLLRHGDQKFVTILISIGLAILIFAMINYINLTVSQAAFRAREMAMRRLLGAARRELFARLIVECTLLCLLSFLIAAGIASVLSPHAVELLDIRQDRVSSLPGSLPLSELLTPAGLGVSLAVILIMGLISGWMPATIISNVNPLDITRGSLMRKNKMVFSKYFIILQHVITVMLLVAALTITLQTQYLIHAPLGYHTAGILATPTYYFENEEERDRFFDEAGQLAAVKRTGRAGGLPYQGDNNWTVSFNHKNIGFQTLAGDPTCFDMFGFKKLHDYRSSNPEATFFSRQAMKEAELEDGATEFRHDNGTIHIAGVMEDIQIGNITFGRTPVMYFFLPEGDRRCRYILTEIQGNPSAGYRQVKQLYERITGLEFDGKFIDERIEESFAAQRRTSKIILIFTGIAILISLLGLLAMSTYFIRQRTREIAIRKVHGAKNSEILIRLVRSFLTCVGIAFVIAVPVIGYIMHRWLEDYTYRIRLSPWIFIAVGAFCFLVSLFTVLWQSRIAANANPVKALKSE
ncbi:MAG: ABC transporter permease [Tannerella sp.]|jgi:putative ABC transport system permease protein|nr:ABC transporter permease [Tannerella sp.]